MNILKTQKMTVSILGGGQRVKGTIGSNKDEEFSHYGM